MNKYELWLSKQPKAPKPSVSLSQRLNELYTQDMINELYRIAYRGTTQAPREMSGLSTWVYHSNTGTVTQEET